MLPLSLLCWNVAGRVRRLDEQAAAVLAAGTDLVFLQEITATTREAWSERLRAAGLTHVRVSEVPPDGTEAGRRLSVLIAARWPLRDLELPGAPWPERVLAATLTPPSDGQDRTLEVVNMHSPISPKPDLAKVRTHEAVHAHLAAGAGARLLCGDLNTPRKEHADGRVWTFARDRYGRMRPDRGERWDEAELALIRGLEAHGLRDAFRMLHGPEVREVSWEWPRWGGGYRLDHLIVSAGIEVVEMEYRHGWRRAGLSDHSPLLAQLRL